MFIARRSRPRAPAAWLRWMPTSIWINWTPSTKPSSRTAGRMLSILDSLADVPAAEWNALQLRGNPFVRHEFLSALETTGCATDATGWQARHLILRNDRGMLLGAAPLYLKTH